MKWIIILGVAAVAAYFVFKGRGGVANGGGVGAGAAKGNVAQGGQQSWTQTAEQVGWGIAGAAAGAAKGNLFGSGGAGNPAGGDLNIGAD